MTVRTDFARASAAELEALQPFAPATLHEAMGQKGAMAGAIKPIYPGMRVCGSALTVDCPAGDNLSIHAAVERAQAGEVLVIDYKEFLESGPFGDILATACLARGVRDLVIDGCVRDGAAIQAMGFPVFARGLNMKGTVKARLGAVGVPIICAGVPVAPGDAVVGDDDGVVGYPGP